MATARLKAAILIVSETAARDPSTDATGSILGDVFKTTNEGRDWVVAETRIVPDSIQEIQRTILQWTGGTDIMNLVVTSGGTGFAEKDLTPEVWDSHRISVR